MLWFWCLCSAFELVIQKLRKSKWNSGSKFRLLAYFLLCMWIAVLLLQYLGSSSRTLAPSQSALWLWSFTCTAISFLLSFLFTAYLCSTIRSSDFSLSHQCSFCHSPCMELHAQSTSFFSRYSLGVFTFSSTCQSVPYDLKTTLSPNLLHSLLVSSDMLLM